MPIIHQRQSSHLGLSTSSGDFSAKLAARLAHGSFEPVRSFGGQRSYLNAPASFIFSLIYGDWSRTCFGNLFHSDVQWQMCRGRSIQLSSLMGRWFFHFGAGSPDSPCSSYTPHCCSPPISSLSSFLDSFSSGSNQQNKAQVNSWCQQCICKIRVSPMYALAGYNAQWANKLANICSIECGWVGFGWHL